MRTLQTWLTMILLLLVGSPQAAPPAVPAALEDWRGWVLHGHETLQCPRLFGHAAGDPSSHVCAWPGMLQLDADAGGARFSIDWQVEATPQDVPLPGDSEFRPFDVTVDGRDAVVLLAGGRPTLRIEPGRHRIEGRFEWQRRPEQLALPASIGLVRLSVDDKPIAAPERDEQRLWLGRDAEQLVGADTLSLRVYRLLADGVPQMLDTELQLEVSGRAREQALGVVLPSGFVPSALHSPLPARLDADGMLHVQLRPGSWRLQLQARNLAIDAAFSPPSNPAPWPEEEIWSFRADAALRSVQPLGERPVDPQQVGTPWGESLPSFVLTADAALQLDQRSRGLDPDRPHRLHLERSVWLDFRGGGLTAQDRIGGTLAEPGRLELAAPWQLLHATAHEQPLLVTVGADSAAGIELRRREAGLQALARRDSLDGALTPGWSTDFESMTMDLHLPPGWRLLHAGGNGAEASTWVSQWTLLDLFLLALATLLAHRLLGIPFAALVLGYLLLGYQQPAAPLWTLLGVMLAGLLLRWLPTGRFASAVSLLRALLFAAAVLWALPFAAGELKLALYPQLECDAVGSQYDGGCVDAAPWVAAEPAMLAYREEMVSDAAPPPPPPAPSPMAAPAQTLDRIEVAGTRMKRVDTEPAPALDAYPKDAIVQAGPGEPDWRWRVATIAWDGPVLADEALQLWLSPPWLSRIWRAALVLLLGAVLLQLGRRLRVDGARPPSSAPAAHVTGAALAVLLALPFAADAAGGFPPQPLLDTLRERLLQPPACAPACASVAEANLQLDGSRLRLVMKLQAVADSAVPLPETGKGAMLQPPLLDGVVAPLLRRDGAHWLRVSRGVHVVELEWRLAADSIDLRFPLPPARLLTAAEGWEIAGLQLGRLQGDTLQLVRSAPAADASDDDRAGTARTSHEFPPFVRVVRHLQLDLDWSVTTRVERIAPAHAGFSIDLPLLDGERVLDTRLIAEGGRLSVAFAAGEREISWRSQLPVDTQVAITAGPLSAVTERWLLSAGPLWHVEHAGVPEIESDAEGTRAFQPLPGETLQLQISRPAAVAGASVAIDRADLEWRPGERASDATLTLQMRSTRGGQHVLTLADDAELIAVRLRDQTLALRLVDGRLSLPLTPGEQTLVLQWREPHGLGVIERSPAVDLGAPAANIDIVLALPERRWLLATAGGGIGPAVLLWPQLLLMLLLAVVLARVAPTPLRTHHWALLGLGFSTVSWPAAVVVAGWLLLIGWRAGVAARVGDWPRWRFGLLQLGVLLATLAAVLCLVVAIPSGLLGDPQMQVAGNGSLADWLSWFFDRSDAALPQVAAWSLPLWLYKLAMLAWALWLANALIGWLRWAWLSGAAGGYWPARRISPVAKPEDRADAE